METTLRAPAAASRAPKTRKDLRHGSKRRKTRPRSRCGLGLQWVLTVLGLYLTGYCLFQWKFRAIGSPTLTEPSGASPGETGPIQQQGDSRVDVEVNTEPILSPAHAPSPSQLSDHTSPLQLSAHASPSQLSDHTSPLQLSAHASPLQLSDHTSPLQLSGGTPSPAPSGHPASSSNSRPQLRLRDSSPGAAETPMFSRPRDDRLPMKYQCAESCQRLHAFYYPWYGTPAVDGEWVHWDHAVLPHWDARHREAFPHGEKHAAAQGDIAAAFWPALGAYSSRDPAVLADHMDQAAEAGVGVLVVSWYPPSMHDDNGLPLDPLLPLILDAAAKAGRQVAIHMEPFAGRSSGTVASNLEYIVQKYGRHKALYRVYGRPVVYVYDSYQIEPEEWQEVLVARGQHSIRGAKHDCFVVGLALKEADVQALHMGGFDAVYTYFSAQSSQASEWAHWRGLSAAAERLGLHFIPSVGPGYDDTRVRPWNGGATKDRSAGEYYDRAFKSALAAKTPFISITSFNEWHEGSQIERAYPHRVTVYTDTGSSANLRGSKAKVVRYKDYSDVREQRDAPGYYLRRTNYWRLQWAAQNGWD